MTLKKFIIAIVKILFSLFLIMVLFSLFADFSFKGIITNMFGYIYDYSNEETRDKVLTNLIKSCNTEETSYKTKEICENETLLIELKENCNIFYELKEKGKFIGNTEEMEESCNNIMSGEFERACREIKEAKIKVDEAKINKLCESYNKKEIDDRGFFTGILSSPILEEPDTDKIGINMGWWVTINKYSILILAILLVLLILLHIGNFKAFFKLVGDILFLQGIFIIVSYLFLKIYINFSKIDTSFILDTAIEGAQPKLQTLVIKLLPLIFLRIYTIRLVIIAAILLAIGLMLKIIFRKPSESGT